MQILLQGKSRQWILEVPWQMTLAVNHSKNWLQIQMLSYLQCKCFLGGSAPSDVAGLWYKNVGIVSDMSN